MKVLAVVAILCVAALAFSLPKPVKHFPKVNKRGPIVVEPPKMPCAFEIGVSSRVDYYVNGSIFYTFADTSIAYFDGTMTTKYSFHFGVLEYDTVIYRPDQSYKDDKTGNLLIPKYTAMFDMKQGVNETCEMVGVTAEEMNTELESDFAGFLEKHTCDTYEDGTYNGEAVKVCVTTESGNPQNLYVNKDGYFIGSSLTMKGADFDMVSSFNFTYTFEEPDLKVFTVDEKIVSICEKKAYEVPDSMCNTYSSDSGLVDSSNSVKSANSAQSYYLSSSLLLACFLFLLL